MPFLQVHYIYAYTALWTLLHGDKISPWEEKREIKAQVRFLVDVQYKNTEILLDLYRSKDMQYEYEKTIVAL